MTTKLIGYGFIFALVVLAGWYIFGVIEENGELSQANSTLKEAVKTGQKELKKIKSIAAMSAGVVVETELEKTQLKLKSAKLEKELEILKYENADVKKWTIGLMPSVLAYGLLDFSLSDNGNGLFDPTEKPIKTNRRAEIEVQNENLYKYADELKTALRSCNADKSGLRDWYNNAGIILE